MGNTKELETRSRQKLNELSRQDPDRPALSRLFIVEGFRWFVIFAVVAFGLLVLVSFLNAIQ